ncbi:MULTISPECIES: hypothetical protein [unclassified Micromonospora]|uniref:hypothetical protein n=1 Tax=unclassified Micromonospora TaxID=2617518 RepID=UPI003A8412C1
MIVSRRLAAGRIALFLGVAGITIIQGIASVASKSQRWSGHWANSSVVIGWAGVWGACIAAGATALILAAPRSRGYDDLLRASSRSQARIHLAGLATVAAGSLAGYTVVTGYVAAATATSATHGGLDIVELLPTAASVPLAVGIGALLGRLAPPRIAPVAAAVAPYLIYMAVVYAEAYSGQIAYMDLLWTDQVDRTYLRLPAELLVSRAVLWMMLGVALLGLSLHALRLAYASAVVASLSAAVALLSVGTRIEVPAAYAAACSGEQPRVCVDRAHDHILPEYQREIVTSVQPVQGLDLSAMVVVMDEHLAVPGADLPGSGPDARRVIVPIVKRNTSPAHEIDSATLTANVGFALFLAPCMARPTAAEDVGLTTAAALYHWWLTSHGLPTDGTNFPGEPSLDSILIENEEAARTAGSFVRLVEEERQEWFSESTESVLTCTAVPAR